MKIKNIIFSLGFEKFDNEYMQDCKGFRGDILVEDEKSNFYSLCFENLDIVTPCIYGLENTYTYNDNGNWIIVENLNVKVIFETIKKLEKDNFFIKLEPISPPTKVEKNNWTVVKFNNYKKSEFYLNIYPNKDGKESIK